MPPQKAVGLLARDSLETLEQRVVDKLRSELVDELCVVCLVSSPYLNGGLCSHTDRLDGPILGNFAGDVPRVDDLLLGFGLVVRGWHGCRRVLVRHFRSRGGLIQC